MPTTCAKPGLLSGVSLQRFQNAGQGAGAFSRRMGSLDTAFFALMGQNATMRDALGSWPQERLTQ